MTSTDGRVVRPPAAIRAGGASRPGLPLQVGDRVDLDEDARREVRDLHRRAPGAPGRRGARRRRSSPGSRRSSRGRSSPSGAASASSLLPRGSRSGSSSPARSVPRSRPRPPRPRRGLCRPGRRRRRAPRTRFPASTAPWNGAGARSVLTTCSTASYDLRWSIGNGGAVGDGPDRARVRHRPRPRLVALARARARPRVVWATKRRCPDCRSTINSTRSMAAPRARSRSSIRS